MSLKIEEFERIPSGYFNVIISAQSRCFPFRTAISFNPDFFTAWVGEVLIWNYFAGHSSFSFMLREARAQLCFLQHKANLENLGQIRLG